MNQQQLRDRAIREAFQARAESAPSSDLAEVISATIRRTSQERSLHWMPDVAARHGQRLLWAAVISLLSLGLLGVLLIGGRRDDRQSVVPSLGPTSTPSAFESPTESAQPSESPLETPHEAAFSVDAFVEVAVPGGIPIRTQPDPGAPPASAKLFPAGVPFLVADGPTGPAGTDWYYLIPAVGSTDIPAGWAPATDGANPVLVPASVHCPTSPLTSAQLIAIRPYGPIGCFSQNDTFGPEIIVSGPVSCTAAAATPGVDAPSWSRPDRRCAFVAGSSGEPYPVFGDPIFDIVPAGTVAGAVVDGTYELTGHFDDERCGFRNGTVTDETRPGILLCRSWFIVTGVRPAGVSVDSVVRTVSDNLRVRSAPGVGVSSAKLEPLLRKGTKLFVIEGHVAADGYDWYHVLAFDGGLPGGWVAGADHDGTPWLAGETQACPTLPLAASALLSMNPCGGLACFGSKEIEVIGDIRCELATVDRPITGPDWIRTNRQCRFELGGETIEFFDGGIQGLGLPTTGAARVTGHFDDSQATSCVYSRAAPKPDPVSVVANCRAMFVATDLMAAP